MRPIYIVILIILTTFTAPAQVLQQDPPVEQDSLPAVYDPHYREDQFYTSIAYNLIQDKPSGYSQNSLSINLNAGLLRDMPINTNRTKSIAVGLGYSYNNIKHNLLINRIGSSRSYYVDSGDTYDKNKLVLHYVEVPIEFRWRNSDAVSHKFWRVYTGFKVSYLFADKAQYTMGGTKTTVTNNDDLNKIVYGAYISAGWNTWNFHAYYGLNPLFKSGVLSTGEDVKLRTLNLGLMFYIL